ncbi:hypothetical protein FH972_002560 [Carpinus fangiana]|uniref:Uncharacterized protein n=1 Tax=Carpinus fangiana TaxID=176857 RepID=A0A5N6QHW5_9ROSI|nr:hypothetical protein FH972_002560 [Carpinus fangiana]
MRSGVSASASQRTLSSPPSIHQNTRYYYASSSLVPRTLSSPDLKLKGLRLSGVEGPHRIRIACNSSTRPGGSGSGDGDSKSVLDAFFLGKALAEALNERIESTVGEFLSAIGRLQAEQQKQVQDFQEDVLERAKRAKERAAREAMEAQGLISKPTTERTTPATNHVNSVTSSTTSATASTNPSSLSGLTPTTLSEPDAANKEEPVLGVSNDD